MLQNRLEWLNDSSDDEVALATSTEIMESIAEKDAERLKSVFSETALAESEDMDEAIEYLFAVLDGDDITWETDGNLSSYTRSDGGEKTSKLREYIEIKKGEDAYVMFVKINWIDTEFPENVGVFNMILYTDADWDTGPIPWTELTQIPGVSIPGDYIDNE